MAGFGDWLGGLFGGGGGGDLVSTAQQAIQPQGYSLGGSGGLDTSGIFGGMGQGGGGFSPNLDTATPPSGGGGGGGSWWSGLGDVAKQALPAAQLGSTALGMYGGIKSMQQGGQQMDVLKRQQQNQERMAAPAAAAGAQLTTAGSEALMGGKLPPQQETQVQAYADQLRQQYRSYLANIGMSDSSAAVEMEGFINQQVAAYRQQLAQSLYGAGMQGIGTALGPSSAASGTAAGVVSGTEQKLAGANASLSKMLGSQS